MIGGAPATQALAPLGRALAGAPAVLEPPVTPSDDNGYFFDAVERYPVTVVV